MSTHTKGDAPIGFPEAASDKGLKSGALGLMSSIVIGMASTAPAYSLAASLGFVVATANGDGIVGVKAPSIMLLAFIPMFFIAIAYQQLNKAEPDCGTTFTWATRAFGPRAGWIGGWGIIAADVIVMANLAQIAGSYGFQLFGLDGLAESTFWSMVAGVAWIIVMTYICYRGIEVSARLQYVLLGIEVVVLVIFSAIALIKVYGGSAPEGYLVPSLSWLWPSGMSLSALVTATLIAVFIYWGWDTAVSVNEETSDPAKTPGRAAVISTLLLLLTYAIVSVATVAFAGTGESGLGLANPDNSGDVFHALGPSVFGDSGMGKAMEILLILSVLSSASASTQTTILPTARTTLAMGAYKAVPSMFARIHPKYMTPTVATVWMGAVSIIFYVGLTLVSGDVLGDSIAAVGLMIAFYYGITGFAAVWFYRHDIFTGLSNFVMKGLFPFLGGVLLLGAFVIASYNYAQPDYGSTTMGGVGGVFIIGIGTLLLGVVLMINWNMVAPAFFRGETLSKRTSSELVLMVSSMEEDTVRLPDSGLPDIIIAPDLSNLPEGMTALDLQSGEEIENTGQLRALREEQAAEDDKDQ
ncbi:MAG: APC family permease [Actinobacteria bacterium]|nr:APC family permease [Actinomycetota bacterium]